MRKREPRRRWPDTVVGFIDEPNGVFCVRDPRPLLKGKGYLAALHAAMEALGYKAVRGADWPRPAHYYTRVGKARNKPARPR